MTLLNFEDSKILGKLTFFNPHGKPYNFNVYFGNVVHITQNCVNNRS